MEYAIQLHHQGKLTEALTEYHRILRDTPHNVDVMRLIGMVLWQQGKLDASERWLRKALRYNEQNSAVLANLGLVVHSRGLVPEAIELYEQVIQISPKTDVYCNLGTAYASKKQWDKAGQAFRNAISMEETCWTAWWALVAVYREQKQWRSATSCLGFLLENQGKSAQWENERGLLAFAQQQWTEARTHFERVVQEQPDWAEGYCNLALAIREESPEHVEVVFQHLEKALALDPSYVNAYIHFGLLLIQEGEEQAAYNTLEYASSRFPHNIDVQVHWALVLARRNPHGGMEQLEGLLGFDGDRVDIWLHLGHLYLELGYQQKAIHAFSRCLALEKNHPEAEYFQAIAKGSPPDIPPVQYLSSLFDGYAPSFERHLQQELQYQTPEHLRVLLEQYVQFPVQKIVDLGCGTGLMGERLHAKATECIGVDVSEKMLRLANKKAVYTDLVHLEVNEYLNTTSDISLIVAADVCNYFGSLQVLLERATAALEPQGYLAFSIEKKSNSTDKTGSTGRFQHEPQQVLALGQQLGLQLLCQQEAKLRKEKGEWVIGVLFLFIKDVS